MKNDNNVKVEVKMTDEARAYRDELLGKGFSTSACDVLDLDRRNNIKDIEDKPEKLAAADGYVHKLTIWLNTHRPTADEEFAIAGVLYEFTVIANETRIEIAYDSFLSEENPMLEAVKAGFIEVINVTSTFNKDANVNLYKLTTRNQPIDLWHFEGYSPRQVFVNGQWREYYQSLVFWLGYRAMSLIGDKNTLEEYKKLHRFKLKAARIATDVKMDLTAPASNDKVPSKNALGRCLQDIADMIVGEGNIKMLNKDANFILLTMVNFAKSKSKPGRVAVALPKERNFLQLLLMALHRAATGGVYAGEYEVIREK